MKTLIFEKTKSITNLMLCAVSIVFLFTSCLCSNNSTNADSIVGTYYADLTLAQSGHMTKIVLNSDGSAVMQEDGYSPKYTYWDYAGKGSDVRISDGRYGWWFIDFDKNLIYYGAQDYRSNQRGYSLRKL